MVPWTTPVRVGTPQLFNYTFLDQNRNVISLTPYATVILEVSQQGQSPPFETQAGSFVSPPLGQVTAIYAFESPGIWQAQFVCYDPFGNPFYGEPIQVRVVANIDGSVGVLLNY
jgi:hypothetical protein